MRRRRGRSRPAGRSPAAHACGSPHRKSLYFNARGSSGGSRAQTQLGWVLLVLHGPRQIPGAEQLSRTQSKRSRKAGAPLAVPSKGNAPEMPLVLRKEGCNRARTKEMHAIEDELGENWVEVPNCDWKLLRVRRRRTSPQKRCMARNRANEEICPGKVRISRPLVDSQTPPTRTRTHRLSRSQVGTQVRARRRARPPQNGNPATVTPSMDAPRPPRLPG